MNNQRIVIEDLHNCLKEIDKLTKELNNQRIAIEDLHNCLKEIDKLTKENEQYKKELKKYTDAFDCSQCRFQNYDWFDDGDEFEVCGKGNNEAQMENHSCSEWEEM